MAIIDYIAWCLFIFCILCIIRIIKLYVLMKRYEHKADILRQILLKRNGVMYTPDFDEYYKKHWRDFLA